MLPAFLESLQTLGSWDPRAVFKFEPPFSHLDGLPLADNALFLNESIPTMRICRKCHRLLSAKEPKLPPRSVGNDLWLGEQTSSMTKLSIPEKLLSSPTRTLAYISKFSSHKKNPKCHQQGFTKGCTIAFQQPNVFKTVEDLPGGIEVLEKNWSIIFAGKTDPTDQQLWKEFPITVF